MAQHLLENLKENPKWQRPINKTQSKQCCMLSAVLVPTFQKAAQRKEQFCEPVLTDSGFQYLKEGKNVF